MADGRQGIASAFLIENRDIVREGDFAWHAEGPDCEGYFKHVHPRSRPPLIVFAGDANPRTTGLTPVGEYQVPRWEVRVTHYREDGSAATVREQLLETELAARTLPIGVWATVRAMAGAAVSQIRHAERERG